MDVNVGVKKDGSPYILRGIDPFLIDLVKKARKRNKRKNMYLLIISGNVGSGKSNMMRILGHLFDKDFNNSRIVFSGNEFRRKSNLLKSYSFIGFDESYKEMNAKAGRGKEFIKIINHLQLLRSRQLFICLCIPNYFDIQKGIACFLSNHLFVVSEQNNRKGIWYFYDRVSKKKLYNKGKLTLDFFAHTYDYHGHCPVIPDKEETKQYEKLKDQYVLSQQEDEEKKRVNPNLKRDILIFNLKTKKKMGTQEISNIVGLDQSTVHRIIATQRNKLSEVDTDESIQNKNILMELENE